MQTELMAHNKIDCHYDKLTRPDDLGFRRGSQNHKVYTMLHDKYIFAYPSVDHTWVSTKRIAAIVPGGVTRRINDIRVALQPEKSLRGKVGWYVDNDVKWVYDEVKKKKVKHSWYRLVYLTEGAGQ